MADTKRTKTDLLALLADNTSGDVSPQDLRDVVESWDLSRGGYYWSAFGTTTLTLQGTQGPGGTNYYKLGGTTATTPAGAVRFTHTNPNRLTYTGTPDIRFNLRASFSFKMSAAAVLGFQVYKNGAAEVHSYQQIDAEFSLSALATHVSILADGTLSTNDFLEVWANCQSAAGRVLTPLGGVVVVNEEAIG